MGHIGQPRAESRRREIGYAAKRNLVRLADFERNAHDMANENVIEFTDGNFDQEVIQAGGAVLVDFWAPWCAPCHAIAPHIDALAQEYQGKAKVGKVNVDEAPNVAMRYAVRSIPTVLVFKGGEVVAQHVGAVGKAHLEDALKKAL